MVQHYHQHKNNQLLYSYVSFSSDTRPVVRDLQIILNKDITNNTELKNKIIPLVNLLHEITSPQLGTITTPELTTTPQSNTYSTTNTDTILTTTTPM